MIAITHPIKQMIKSQHSFLSSMLERFPSLLDDWVKQQEEEAKQIANDFAEGDKDIFRDTYNSEISRLDSCYDEEQLFNQAMLIMVYSYYESMLLRLSTEIQVNEARPSVIAEHFGKALDQELLKISSFLFNTIAPLRNQLCHNNQGTLFARKSKKREEQIENLDQLVAKKFISIDDSRIVSIDRTFIKNVLDGEYKLLLKLAEICDFNTKWYMYKDGRMVISDSCDEIKEQKRHNESS